MKCGKLNFYLFSLHVVDSPAHPYGHTQKDSNQYHTIIRAAFVCVFVCSISPPRSFDGSSPNLVGVCRWTSELPLRGSFSKRSTGRLVNGSLSLSLYYICARLTPLCRKKHTAPFARSMGYFLVYCNVHCIFELKLRS